jgi:endonuclease YncB( thermonuclease family)
MFHTLHRLYVIAWTLIVLAAAGWAYAYTDVSGALSDWHAVWQNKPKPGSSPAAEFSGTVTKIIDSTSLVVRAAEGQPYSIALQGLVPFEKPASTAKTRIDLAKTRLTELALSNQVHVTLTWVDERRRAIGVVYVGPTNINATLVEMGLVTLKRDFIKPLPMTEQYALIRADRRAMDRKLAASGRP